MAALTDRRAFQAGRTDLNATHLRKLPRRDTALATARRSRLTALAENQSSVVCYVRSLQGRAAKMAERRAFILAVWGEQV